MKTRKKKSGSVLSKNDKPSIGFIGQGFIGKSYADDFEHRGFTVTRYAMEKPYVDNKEKIKECDIVFIAVPTPTTPNGYDYSIVEKVLVHVGQGKTAVIKSTLLPGTTEKLQEKNPEIFVFHSPEFLTARTAAHDAAHPNRNIVGIPVDVKEARVAAEKVLSVLPKAPYSKVLKAREAEFVKYGGNCWFYFKVIFMNLLYDLIDERGVDFSNVRDAMAADPRIGHTHLDPVHQGGRGAGGLCFIKDFAAFSDLYRSVKKDPLGHTVLQGMRDKNVELLLNSGKDLDLLTGVYGESFVKGFKKKK